MAALTAYVPCLQCPPGAPGTTLPLSDGNAYVCTCPNGHECASVLSNPRFELLLEIGARALIDGYPRECVGSFAAGLERFYEFALSTLLQRPATENPFQDFDALWKIIAAQSERQVGAFTACWMLAFGELPEMPNDTRSAFRNRVVHKGIIPSADEAEEYAADILRIIGKNDDFLKANRAVERVSAAHRIPLAAHADLAAKTNVQASGSMLSGLYVTSSMNRTLTFAQLLRRIQFLPD